MVYGVNNYDSTTNVKARQSKYPPHKRPTELHDVITPPQTELDSEPEMVDYEM